MKPDEIERMSFAIIDSEAGEHGFSPERWAVVRRMIHASADFEYIETIRFHERAVEAGVAAIRSGCVIFTDTEMARSGIRERDVKKFGGCVKCLMADPDVARAALEQGITRARAAVDAAAEDLANSIYVVGNAPTALLRLTELARLGGPAPALVIGLPVGFVNAAESKAGLREMDLPQISNVGRKGGSNVAASAVNALIIMAGGDA